MTQPVIRSYPAAIQKSLDVQGEGQMGLFGGPGPVLGGAAGGKDYSLASMLDRANPKKSGMVLQCMLTVMFCPILTEAVIQILCVKESFLEPGMADIRQIHSSAKVDRNLCFLQSFSLLPCAEPIQETAVPMPQLEAATRRD